MNAVSSVVDVFHFQINNAKIHLSLVDIFLRQLDAQLSLAGLNDNDRSMTAMEKLKNFAAIDMLLPLNSTVRYLSVVTVVVGFEFGRGKGQNKVLTPGGT